MYGIGYNSDMSKNAPDACLCSVIWNWGAYYTAAVQSVIDGTWDGSNYYGGMNENLVGITSLADFAQMEHRRLWILQRRYFIREKRCV